MSLIRATTKLPSGISGWYIYLDINEKLYISSPVPGQNHFHTKEDVEFIRDLLNKAIEEMEES